MKIKIEAGCVKQADGTYLYRYTTVEKGASWQLFTVAEGEVPEIGDFIVNGALKKREGYQIENEGKLRWPSDNLDGYVRLGKAYEK